MRYVLITVLCAVCSCGETRISTSRSSHGDAGPLADSGTSVRDGSPEAALDGAAIEGGTRTLELTEVECPPSAPPWFPCVTPCGNGVVDSCEWPWGTFLDECDGPIPPDTPDIPSWLSPSCAARGYAGGTVTCNPYCKFDHSDCTSCLPDPEVLQCLEHLGPRVVRGAAAGRGRLAVAHYPVDGVLQFDQFDQSFAPVADGRCWELRGLGTPMATNWTIGRLASGWLLATVVAGPNEGTLESHVFQLDENGHVLGPSRSWNVETGSRMVSRESGGPLLLTQRNPEGDAHGVLFDASGAVIWDKPLPFYYPTANCRVPVFTRDGFLVVRVALGSAEVVKVDLNGRQVAAHAIDNTCPLLAWNGAEARMVWADYEGGTTKAVHWSRLDADGAPLGSPSTVLMASPFGFQTLVAVAAGVDTLVIFDSHLAGRIDDTGTFSVPPFAFRKLPSSFRLSAFDQTMFELGTDAIVLSQDTNEGGGAGLTRFRR